MKQSASGSRAIHRLISLVAVAGMLGATGLAPAQDEPDVTATIQALWQDIGMLRQINRMGLTGEQRLEVARVIGQYREEREALSRPPDPDAMIEALVVVKASVP